jgi:hypothetical protein
MGLIINTLEDIRGMLQGHRILAWISGQGFKEEQILVKSCGELVKLKVSKIQILQKNCSLNRRYIIVA